MSDLLARSVLDAALRAYSLGITPIPLAHHGEVTPEGKSRAKVPVERRWESTDYGTSMEVRQTFDASFVGNIGVLLGEPSEGLLDVDLDHPLAVSLAPRFLPPTPAKFGRPSKPVSHWLYRAAGEVPRTQRRRDPEGETIAEVRGTGGQTVIPPSIHESGESIEWVGEPWGGADGPAVVDSADLTVRAGLLSLVVLLADAWPGPGSRHDAYLALAGGFLRDDGAEGRVSSFWEETATEVVAALVEATGDREGSDRHAALASTARNLRDGLAALTGWPSLADLLRGDGEAVVTKARRYVHDIEVAAGVSRSAQDVEIVGLDQSDHEGVAVALTSREQFEQTHASDIARERDREVVRLLAREEAIETLADWRAGDEELDEYDSVDLAAFINDPEAADRIKAPEPFVRPRDGGEDCHGWVYEGRVNLLFGPTESGKTFVALDLLAWWMLNGEDSATYVDMDDNGLDGILPRLLPMLGGRLDLQVGRFRYERVSNVRRLRNVLEGVEPGSLVVLDTSQKMYGMTGRAQNKGDDWLDLLAELIQPLTERGCTVLVLDHTAKSAAHKGPSGAHEKVDTISGSAVRVTRTKPFRKGRGGEAWLTVTKDRPGGLRAVATLLDGSPYREAVWGRFSLTASGRTAIYEMADAGGMRFDAETGELVGREDDGPVMSPRAKAVLDVLVTAYPRTLSMRELADIVKRPSLTLETARTAANELLDRGRIERVGAGRAARYKAVEEEA